MALHERHDREHGGQTADVSSASTGEPVGSGPSWKSARGEPIAVQRPRGPALLSALPRAGPTGAPSSRELGAVPPVKSVTRDARRLRVSMVRGEGPLLGPHRPHDPRELVRHGHRSHIVAPSLFDAPRPRLEATRVRTRLPVPQHRSGAMNQQHAEVCIPTLANRAKPAA